MTTIITGAASGIGRAVAQMVLVDCKRRKVAPALTIVDLNAQALSAVGKGLRQDGADVLEIAADLADPATPAQIVEKAAGQFGRIDAVVSNAGILIEAALMDLSFENYERMFAINTRACWLLAKAAYPHLKKTRGSLVAIASISAEQPTAQLGAYSPSKAAVLMLVKQLSDEWGPDGLRCNAVSPGLVHTGMTDFAYKDETVRQRRADTVPLRRIAEPEDIAKVIVFLIGPDAGYVSGANVVVDGGFTNSFMGASRRVMTGPS